MHIPNNRNGNGKPPPVEQNRVAPSMACPRCGENDADALVWLDDDQVRCATCGSVYDPEATGDAP